MFVFKLNARVYCVIRLTCKLPTCLIGFLFFVSFRKGQFSSAICEFEAGASDDNGAFLQSSFLPSTSIARIVIVYNISSPDILVQLDVVVADLSGGLRVVKHNSLSADLNTFQFRGDVIGDGQPYRMRSRVYRVCAAGCKRNSYFRLNNVYSAPVESLGKRVLKTYKYCSM